MLNDGLDFSFSGLKTSVVNHVRTHPDVSTADVAASFQTAVVDVLVARGAPSGSGGGRGTRAGRRRGGSLLRERFLDACAEDKEHGFLPSHSMCTDSAAMIAATGWRRLRSDGPTPLDAAARTRISSCSSRDPLMSAPRINTFAVCTPGLGPFTLAGLERLGVQEPMVRRGGVSCSATWPQLWAMKPARSDGDRGCSCGSPTSPPTGSASCRAVFAGWTGRDGSARCVARSVRIGDRLPALPPGNLIEGEWEVVPAGDGPPQDLYVRVVHDAVTLSLSSSGAPLYRKRLAARRREGAIRKETLAAACSQVDGIAAHRSSTRSAAPARSRSKRRCTQKRIPPGRFRSPRSSRGRASKHDRWSACWPPPTPTCCHGAP